MSLSLNFLDLNVVSDSFTALSPIERPTSPRYISCMKSNISCRSSGKSMMKSEAADELSGWQVNGDDERGG